MSAPSIRRLGTYAAGVCLLMYAAVTWLDPAKLLGSRGVPYARPPAAPATARPTAEPAATTRAPAPRRAPPGPLRVRPPPRAVLVVFAASSLTEAFQELGLAFREQPGGSGVMFNFGGSSWLRTQLEQGAYADVFASANHVQMERLVKAGLVAAPRDFATNYLTMLLPASNPAGIRRPGDLARPGVKLVLAHGNVPVGAYAEEILGRLPAALSLPAGFREKALANVVSRETNVKQVVAKVALGEADAGVVYSSDVVPGLLGQVKTLEIPPEANVIARYPAARTRECRHPELAQAFLDFLVSSEGSSILGRHGLGSAGSP